MILHIQKLIQLNSFFNLSITSKKKETNLKLFLFLKERTASLLSNEIFINDRPFDHYFNEYGCQRILQLLVFSELYKKYNFVLLIYLKGGGIINQNDSVAIALKRLIKKHPKFFKDNLNFDVSKKHFKIDFRKKERKKFGLKKARKASQYHKR